MSAASRAGARASGAAHSDSVQTQTASATSWLRLEWTSIAGEPCGGGHDQATVAVSRRADRSVAERFSLQGTRLQGKLLQMLLYRCAWRAHCTAVPDTPARHQLLHLAISCT